MRNNSFIIGVIAICFLMMGIYSYIMISFPSDQTHMLILDQIEQRLNRKVQIGPTQLKFSLDKGFYIQIDELLVTDKQDGSVFFKAKSVYCPMEFFSLLKKTAVLKNIIFDRPTLVLVRNEQGVLNCDDIQERLKTDLVGANSAPDQTVRIAANACNVIDGKLILTNLPNNREYAFQGINGRMEVKVIDGGSEIKMQVTNESLDILTLPMLDLFNLPGGGFKLEVDYLPAQKKINLRKVRVIAPYGHLQVRGEISSLGTKPQISAVVEGNNLQLEDFISSLPLSMTRRNDYGYTLSGKSRLSIKLTGPIEKPGVIGSLELKELKLDYPTLLASDITDGHGKISFTNDQWECTDLQIEFDKTKLNLSLSKPSNKEHRYYLNITSPRLLLDEILYKSDTVSDGNKPNWEAVRNQQAVKIMQSYLDHLSTVIGKCDISSLEYGELKMGSLKSGYQYSDQKLTLPDLTASVWKGSLLAQGDVDLSILERPVVNVMLKADKLKAEDAMTWVLDNPKLLTGQLAFDGNLNFRGISRTEILSKINGDLNFSVRNGVLADLPFIGAMGKFVGIPENETISFTSLQGNLVLRNGQAKYDSLILKGEQAELQGYGTVESNLACNLALRYIYSADITSKLRAGSAQINEGMLDPDNRLNLDALITGTMGIPVLQVKSPATGQFIEFLVPPVISKPAVVEEPKTAVPVPEEPKVQTESKPVESDDPLQQMIIQQLNKPAEIDSTEVKQQEQDQLQIKAVEEAAAKQVAAEMAAKHKEEELAAKQAIAEAERVKAAETAALKLKADQKVAEEKATIKATQEAAKLKQEAAAAIKLKADQKAAEEKVALKVEQEAARLKEETASIAKRKGEEQAVQKAAAEAKRIKEATEAAEKQAALDAARAKAEEAEAELKAAREAARVKATAEAAVQKAAETKLKLEALDLAAQKAAEESAVKKAAAEAAVRTQSDAQTVKKAEEEATQAKINAEKAAKQATAELAVAKKAEEKAALKAAQEEAKIKAAEASAAKKAAVAAEKQAAKEAAELKAAEKAAAKQAAAEEAARIKAEQLAAKQVAKEAAQVKAAEQKAAEEAAAAKLAEEKVAMQAAQEAARVKAVQEAAAKKAASEAVSKKAAEDAASNKAASEAASRKSAEEAAAKKSAAEAVEKQKAAETAKKTVQSAEPQPAEDDGFIDSEGSDAPPEAAGDPMMEMIRRQMQEMVE